MIWGNISRSVNGENLLEGVAYKNKYIYIPGVHKAKAEECTTPSIGSRNIEIKIGGGRLPRMLQVISEVLVSLRNCSRLLVKCLRILLNYF